MIVHDLNHPDYNPPDCPAWAKETLPPHIQPFRGRNGMPSPYRERDFPLAMTVRGIDRYHANQFITYRPETAEFLYSQYTPLAVDYPKGLLPAFEALAAEVTAGCRTDEEKVLALLKKGAARVKHPCGPPCGGRVAPDRNMPDEALLKSGVGWCNEQARVFIRLCQVSGFPARIVHTHYADGKSGHCITEVYVGGRWAMADASWFCVCPGSDGRWLSAVECHDRGAGQRSCGVAYFNRMQELLKMTDRELGLGDMLDPVAWRREVAAQTADFWAKRMSIFSIINYPLPG